MKAYITGIQFLQNSSRQNWSDSIPTESRHLSVHLACSGLEALDRNYQPRCSFNPFTIHFIHKHLYWKLKVTFNFQFCYLCLQLHMCLWHSQYLKFCKTTSNNVYLTCSQIVSSFLICFYTALDSPLKQVLVIQ